MAEREGLLAVRLGPLRYIVLISVFQYPWVETQSVNRQEPQG